MHAGLEQRPACLTIESLSQCLKSMPWYNAGYENIDKAYECRATLVFNHVSYTDGIMLGAYFLPCGLAKATVADIPFFGSFTKVNSPRHQALEVSASSPSSFMVASSLHFGCCL